MEGDMGRSGRALGWLIGLTLVVAGCGGDGGGQGAPVEAPNNDAPDADADDGQPDADAPDNNTPDADAPNNDTPDADEPDAQDPDDGLRFTPDYLGEDAGDADEGLVQVLTYNVAGLPQGISSSNPREFIPQISPLLNAYDLVLAQEDFAFYEQLRAEVDHPYATVPWVESVARPETVGDGLNRFSRVPFGAFERVPWGMCHGRFDCASDCLATKGFSYAVTKLANGVEVDVYNLHMEAGGCEEDLVARAHGVEVLIAFALERSEGRAMIIGGDFNLHVERDPEDGELFDRLLGALALRDACWEVDCGDERIDRLLVRSSDAVTLTPRSWRVPPEFVTDEGEDLSDHKPVAMELHWARVP